MSAARPANILRQLERSDGAPGTDADLLARFVAARDADAFAELVRRHGPLVLGVCRRVTGQAQDAEDAFQATFLVLAKKAAALRNPELLGNYLYGVAFRVALRAKRSAARRRAREVVVPTLPDSPAPSPQPVTSELLPIIDEELAALPACYREAVVLCDLRGASREAAATALGVPEGTLSSRLAAGRKKLAARLTRRGVTLAAAVVPVVLAEARTQAAQMVPNGLVAKTCGLVADWTAGVGVPTPLSRLVNGGSPVRKLLALGAVMVVGVAGAVFAAIPRDGAPPADPPKPAAVAAAVPEPNAQPKEEAKEKPVTFTTAPRKLRALDVRMNSFMVRWNATGTHLALDGSEDIVQAGAKKARPNVRVIGVGEGAETQVILPGRMNSLVAVAPDGRGAVTVLREHQLISGTHQLRWWAPRPGWDVWPESKTVDLDLPQTREYAFTPDMKSFRTVAYHSDTRDAPPKFEVLEVDAGTGRATKSLLKTDNGPHALSANGKRFALIDKNKRVTVYDLDRGEKVSSAELTKPVGELPPPLSPEMWSVVLSPDGRRLVVSGSVGRTYVLNTDTGTELPALDGTKYADVCMGAYRHPNQGTFTGDGRLFAAIVTPRKPVKEVVAETGKEQTSWQQTGTYLAVWDTQTGKVLKTWNQWNQNTPTVEFNPARPVLAIVEENGEAGVRVGFWDFAAEVEKK